MKFKLTLLVLFVVFVVADESVHCVFDVVYVDFLAVPVALLHQDLPRCRLLLSALVFAFIRISHLSKIN